MDMPKPNWKKIELCSFFLDSLDSRIEEMYDAVNVDDTVETKDELEKKIRDLKKFYTMVINVAFFEWALAYAEIQDVSGKIIEEYLKKKSEEEGFGGDNGKIF